MTEWYDGIVTGIKNALEAVFVKKSNTAGLIKNDGTIDTTSYLNSNQGAGNTGKFLKIDSNGNVICEAASFSGTDLAVTTISGTANLNTYKTTGFYYVAYNNANNILNLPPNSGEYDIALTVEGKSNGYIKQTASYNESIYVRFYNYSTEQWSSWSSINDKGIATNYGNVKLSDNYTSSDGAASASVGASSKAVYDAYTTLNDNKQNKIALWYGNSSSNVPTFEVYDSDLALEIKKNTPIKTYIYVNNQNICDFSDSASTVYVKYALRDTVYKKFIDTTDKCIKQNINWNVGTTENVGIYAFWNGMFLASDIIRITVVDNYS